MLPVFFCDRGYDNAKEHTSAFRQCFSKLGELWSLAPHNTPVLALNWCMALLQLQVKRLPL